MFASAVSFLLNNDEMTTATAVVTGMDRINQSATPSCQDSHEPLTALKIVVAKRLDRRDAISATTSEISNTRWDRRSALKLASQRSPVKRNRRTHERREYRKYQPDPVLKNHSFPTDIHHETNGMVRHEPAGLGLVFRS